MVKSRSPATRRVRGALLAEHERHHLIRGCVNSNKLVSRAGGDNGTLRPGIPLPGLRRVPALPPEQVDTDGTHGEIDEQMPAGERVHVALEERVRGAQERSG